MTEGSETDPQARLAELRERREAIEAEVGQVESGDIPLLDDTALRDHHSYSVLLAVFRNAGYDQTVTLAQVFWMKEVQGQPARFYVTSERDLSIGRNSAHFGTDVGLLGEALAEDKPGFLAQRQRLSGLAASAPRARGGAA